MVFYIDFVGRAQLLERLTLLEQASLDFPDQDFVSTCHHIINDVAVVVPSSPDILGELARATQAAAQQRPRVACAILRALLTVRADA